MAQRHKINYILSFQTEASPQKRNFSPSVGIPSKMGNNTFRTPEERGANSFL